MTVRALAALLGVSRQALYAAIRRGLVPGVVRWGRPIRVRRQAVLRWLEGKEEGKPSKGAQRRGS
ncbi:MAG: helix-turn-helix domain-containing protein [Armatimonadota bacterium]|nr:helix-turn-helix domain-containing protein [Armatimonadota bacterium]MDR7444607.1 helix-turn-helix domain-containing protein [Armatimonadota bacterium]MDR7569433.1 helix-turn-helix domain-containing protein [Armatimonadota bacterium]